MNEKLYRLCSKIPDADRKKDLGAFFGSIHNTLDHIVWADEALLIRLRDEDRAIERHQPPRISDFDELWKARQVFDDEISSWAEVSLLRTPSTVQSLMFPHSGSS